MAVCLDDVVEAEYLADGGPQCTEAHAGVQEGSSPGDGPPATQAAPGAGCHHPVPGEGNYR